MLKAIANDKISFIPILKFVLGGIENIVGKESASYSTSIFFFPTMF